MSYLILDIPQSAHGNTSCCYDHISPVQVRPKITPRREQPTSCISARAKPDYIRPPLRHPVTTYRGLCMYTSRAPRDSCLSIGLSFRSELNGAAADSLALLAPWSGRASLIRDVLSAMLSLSHTHTHAHRCLLQ